MSTVSKSGSLSSWLSLLYARGWPFIKVKRAIKWPYTCPLLPRTSSGTSGFFSWGMIEDPVQKALFSSMKSNWGEDHNTSSSEQRDRWVRTSAAAGAEPDGEVPIAHGIQRVLGDGLEAEPAGREGTVDGEARPGQRRRPERHDVHPAAAIGKSSPIAEKHLEPGQECCPGPGWAAWRCV